MRNIRENRAFHNPSLAGAWCLGLLLILVAGCQARDRQAGPKGTHATSADRTGLADSAAATPAARRSAGGAGSAAGGPAGPAVQRVAGCAVVVDVTGVEAFEEIAGRLTQGRPVPKADFTRLLQQPTYAALLASSGGQLFGAGILRNVMAYVYGGSLPTPDEPGAAATSARAAGRPEAGRPDLPDRAPKRRDLVTSFSYARDHGDRIDACLARFPREGACEVRRLVEPWVRPGSLPDTLTIAFLVAGPDVRLHGKQLLVDAGVAAAARPDQLPRLLAAHLYRGVAAAGAVLPTQAGKGREALVATFAALQREAAAAWIEGYPDIRFDADHPVLGKADAARLKLAVKAEAALSRMNVMLGPLLTDRTALATKGAVIDDMLRVNGSYAPTGYMMAALIAARRGEARLRAALTGDPADFLRAYQDAARNGPGAAPAAADTTGGVIGPAELASLPPFADAQFDNLMDLLGRSNRR